MAAKQKTNDFDTIMATLKAGNYKPVYLLMGQESYYIDKVCDYIVDNALREEEKDFNLTMVYGADTTAQQVMDQARRYPMMAERQVVVVREAQALKDFEAFEKYMDNIVPTTILVLCYMGGTVDARKKLVAKANALGTVFTSESPQYDRDIIEFIKKYLAEQNNASIEDRAAAVVAAHIGGDLKRLTSELDKVLISFAPGAPRKITQDLVEQKIGISKNYNVFELRDALIARDALKAQRIVKYFDENPKAGGLYAILPQTFTFFQNLIIAYYTPRPITESAIMTQLQLRTPYQAKAYMAAMRSYPARKVVDIVAKIREVDARSKGLDNVNATPGDLLKELVAFILN
jgi:DNA polymerase-3 subunit delta